jgi:hypothetical protein
VSGIGREFVDSGETDVVLNVLSHPREFDIDSYANIFQDLSTPDSR